MTYNNLFSVISLGLFVFIGNTALAACPSADLNDDCFVDYEDFGLMCGQWLNGYDSNDLTEMANQWLTTDPCVPDDMVYIPGGEFDMGVHFEEGYYDERPVHMVSVDSFFMSKYEITNQQYCDYLNDANSLGQIKADGGVVYASSDSGNSYPYCDTNSIDPESQIDYSGSVFSVREKGGRDMSDDPMVEVSWYGAASYCNWRSSQEGYESCYNLSTWECDFSKHGHRLPTEAEWEYAARGGQHNPYYRFPWGDTISHNQANYYADPCSYPYDVNPTEGSHPDWDDGIYPYTSVVGSFAANGYGLYDMTGNVWEWCNDWYDDDYYYVSPYDNPEGPASGIYRVMRGGGWNYGVYYSRVAYRDLSGPDNRSFSGGFRIVLDLE
jgi:formylglycine-generating enzyme required for sulfatase activity